MSVEVPTILTQSTLFFEYALSVEPFTEFICISDRTRKNLRCYNLVRLNKEHKVNHLNIPRLLLIDPLIGPFS